MKCIRIEKSHVHQMSLNVTKSVLSNECEFDCSSTQRHNLDSAANVDCKNIRSRMAWKKKKPLRYLENQVLETSLRQVCGRIFFQNANFTEQNLQRTKNK